MQKGRFYGYSILLLVLGLFSLTTLGWLNQAIFQARFSYPAPQIPEWSVPGRQYTSEELLPYARRLVESTHGRFGMGPINSGEKILVIAPQSQDQLTFDVIKAAMQEKGAAQVDLITYDQLPPIGRYPGSSEPHPDRQVRGFGRDLRYGSGGHLEWERLIINEPGAYIGQRNISAWYMLNWIRSDPETTEIDPNLWKEYDKIYAMEAGPFGRELFQEHYRGYWPHDKPNDLVFPFNHFPSDLYGLIDDTVTGFIRLGVAEIRHTDPEGTDLTIVIGEEESQVFAQRNHTPGHLFMMPSPYSSDKFEGVIAGASNHWGFFPLIKLYVRDGQVYDVEGGGDFGAKFKAYMERYKDVQWPGFPRPGYFWVGEDALGTNPKGGRPYWRLVGGTGMVYPNVDERNRSGVVHFGIGIECSASEAGFESCMEWTSENRMPFTHSPHIHIQFSTIQYKMRDTGQWETIVDKGRVNANDDPEVRSLATKYGDPNEVLRTEWIPVKPTINYPGSWEDYVEDPWKYVEMEAAGLVSGIPASSRGVWVLVGFWILLAAAWALMFRSYRQASS